ncbi:MAG: M48 family metallopeptidase [Gammaproteobacteria bacterium]|nr:M48 family metallopeptidase [Gammaproteobacteria bacterium]
MIKGWLYTENSSARKEAELFSDEQSFRLTSSESEPVSGSISELEISQRVGNIPRKITFPDRSLFETAENDAVDSLLSSSGHKSRHVGMLHIFESCWQWVAIALVATLAVGFSTVYWGMPYASKKIAYSMPVAVTAAISDQTLALLDKSILEESKLDPDKQNAIREHFKEKLLTLQNEGFEYELHFRDMPKIPNAFALPSGDIIITDRLVQLADSQEEIDSVLLHEIGHVVHRHGLQRVLHSSFVTFALVLASGDITAINSLAAAIPIFLLESHYSRENETESDVYAFEHMINAGIDPIYFSTIMDKMIKYSLVEDKVDDGNEPDHESSSKKNTSNEEVMKDKADAEEQFKYFSSHPLSQERIELAKKYSEKFSRQISR